MASEKERREALSRAYGVRSHSGQSADVTVTTHRAVLSPISERLRAKLARDRADLERRMAESEARLAETG